MAATTQKPNFGALVLIGVLLYVSGAFDGLIPSPSPSPNPDPEKPEPTALAHEVAKALEGTPDGTCEQFAAFYSAASEYLVTDEVDLVIRKRMDVVTKTRDTLEIPSTELFKFLVSREFATIKGDDTPQNQSAVLKRLSDACRAAEDL